MRRGGRTCGPAGPLGAAARRRSPPPCPGRLLLTLSRTCAVAPVGTGAFQNPHSSARELCRWGGGCSVTWPGSQHGPLPGPTAFPRPTLFPAPCQNPNRIIRPDGCPALPKHKPSPRRRGQTAPAQSSVNNPLTFFRLPAGKVGKGWQGSGCQLGTACPQPQLSMQPLLGTAAEQVELCHTITSPPSARVRSGAQQTAS